MKTDFDYKDREPAVQELETALRMVGLNINYEAASLIKITLNRLESLGKNFSIKDAVEIQIEEENKFEEYYKSKDDTTIRH